MSINYSSFVIQEDSRNKVKKHDNKNNYFQEKGIRVLRSKLPFGDYALVNNTSLCIDTKQSLLEVENNLTKEHVRFRNEITNANSFGIGIIILIEESVQYISLDDVAERYIMPKWKSTSKALINGKYQIIHKKGEPMGKFDIKAIVKAMKTMQEKYAVIFSFTTSEKCGEAIIDMLINNRTMIDNYFKNKLKELNFKK